MEQPLLPVRLSISEAAKLFGVSVKTIRQALKREEIRYIIARGRYKLNFESVLKWSQESTRRRNLLSSSGVGQYVDKWKIQNKKYSPNIPAVDNTLSALKKS
ncbi:MAG: helix-turn-helix domain-containing protein [Patescibacteria group bacterium]|jgi:excisionase family DNA binding protein